MAFAGRGTRCRLHGGDVGSRVFLGDDQGPPRVAVCATCDIPSSAYTDGAVLTALPDSLREVAAARLKAV